MNEIKTLDDLIDFVNAEIAYNEHEHSQVIKYSDGDYYDGSCNAYRSVMEEIKELKSNMQKQNNNHINFLNELLEEISDDDVPSLEIRKMIRVYLEKQNEHN